MKKIFTLLSVCLMASNMFAQTDVTRFFLSNYGFDKNYDYSASSNKEVKQEILSVDGWTSEIGVDYTIVGVYEFGFSGTFNTASVPAKGYDGEAGGCLAISTGWSQVFKFSQSVSLPAGQYTIKVPTYNGCGVPNATSQLAWIPSTGTSVTSKVNSYKANDWTLDEISFTLTQATTGKIQIGMIAAANGSANSAKLCLDYVQILGKDMVADKAPLKTAITTANNKYGDGKGQGAADFKSAIDAAQAVYDNADADAVAVLEAISNVKAATVKYADLNVSEDSPKDYTSYLTNPSFENGDNGWKISGLVSQSNSSFTKKAGGKYMEKWVAAGTSVGNASAVQMVKNLPVGKYKLTVGAQNLDQNSTSAKRTGTYIYAGDQKTQVYTPDDYSVVFVNLTGQVEIGYVAKSANGNWLAVDNFRLYYIGDVDQEAILVELKRISDNAAAMLEKNMSGKVKQNLQDAVNAANDVVDKKVEYTSSVTNNLNDAIEKAQISIDEYSALSTSLTTAKTYVGKYMTSDCSKSLNAAITDAEAIINGEKDYAASVKTAIDTAIDGAKASISAYTTLSTTITSAKRLYDETKNGAAEFKAALESAEAVAQNTDVKTADVEAAKVAVDKALLSFNIANATPGTGTAPRISNTYKYVITGATQALVRATVVGSNILERGVCWSTERNPSVLDDRTTDSYTNNGTIFHISGLKPATVYYVRPYVMNKTYTVAYGDEIKIVTHPKGNCTWYWDEAGPDDATNDRCRNAVRQTIEFFNEWTGIKGFGLSGHYVPGAGAGGGTADCSYGGWMRISQNQPYQAIGTVLHETGHGVGVGTSARWADKNVHNWKWFGREANQIYSFLENKEADPYNSEFCMVGDGTHGWGASASYDWFVNGADKDKHTDLQYIGGCALLYGLFIDGLCPTYSYTNGISGYTYNFDSDKKYYIMNKNANRGLGEGLLVQGRSTTVGWKPCLTNETMNDSAAWTIEYDAAKCYYSFKNVASGKYLTHANSGTTVTAKTTSSPSTTEYFQLMPDRTNVVVGTGANKITTHGYWFTWNNGSDKAMSAGALGAVTGYGSISQAGFDYSDAATAQQWIIISEDDIEKYRANAFAVGIEEVIDDAATTAEPTVVGIYTTSGAKVSGVQHGVNIIRYSDGTSKKVVKE